jgi:hypothetical protein
MDECGLLCHLGIIDQGNAYYILKIESPATISVRSHEGKSLSLSLRDRQMFAGLAARQRSGVDYRRPAVERATPTTITDAQQLREELGRIRARGWSFDNGEDYPDVRCVAAPVFNANNDLTAAISVVGTRLQSMKTIAIIWPVRRLPARKIFHVCWGGKAPSNNSPHHKENIMTLPKIKHVRAWFIRRRHGRAGAGGGDYHDQGALD